MNNEEEQRSLLLVASAPSYVAPTPLPVFHDFTMVGGDMTVGATRAPTTGARVICRGGYESGECPFGRNIILNDDIGGARGGARNRARSGPSTYALHARK